MPKIHILQIFETKNLLCNYSDEEPTYRVYWSNGLQCKNREFPDTNTLLRFFSLHSFALNQIKKALQKKENV